MDPLSDVLSLLKPRRYLSSGFDAGGAWAVRFTPFDSIKCYAIVSGSCWMTVDGVPEPVWMETGDCFLLPRGVPFCLASDLSLPAVDARAIFAATPDGGVAVCNGGGDFFLVGSRFFLSGSQAGILLGMLPPVIHIRRQEDRAALRWSVEQLMQELRERQPGNYLMAEHLAHMMLVQALRVYLAEGTGGGVGWLFALADRQMAAAIGLIHGDPAYRWSVQELARRVGMSRSAFALRFKATVGVAPMDYLTRWRMLRAGERLENSADPVSVLAQSLGYESESAFSTAFKRIMGCSPRQYGAGRRPPGDDTAEQSGRRL
jgi:AraC-like DNA-binding protein